MPDTTEETPATVLRAAAVRMRERGLHRGEFVDDETGAVCAVGAIDDLRPGCSKLDRMATEVQMMATHVLALFLGERVTDWSDHIARDAEDVATTMEAAAEKWEADRAG